MISEAVRLEREKRKTKREERFWELIGRKEVIVPLLAIGGSLALQKLGETRVINRDFAGFMMATWTGIIAAQAGVTDKYALAAISAAAAAAYAIATPPTESEALVTIDPGKLLGGDGKLFWWDIPFMEGR
jgi:hypothetical protein